jgi:hypothetical protein
MLRLKGEANKMKKVFILLSLFFVIAVSIPVVEAKANPKIAYTEADYKRLNAVINHVENILKYGRRYNTETQLLPDAINTLTGEPAKWVFPNRAEVPYADLANQQNFFRTLVALSKVTSDPKYKGQAVATLEEFMDNYQDPNGLFYWGGHRVINLDTLAVQSTEGPDGPHELKNMMPYYELMYEVDPDATLRFMRQLWTAHYEWATSDLNRHGSYSTTYDPNVFGLKIPADIIKIGDNGRPIIPDDSPGKLPFVNSATDLSYAALTLSEYTYDPVPTEWAKYLMKQYNLASDPVTGMTVYQFKSTLVTKSPQECANPEYTNSGCGDRAKRQFRDFGEIAREANIAWKNTQAIYVDNILMLVEAGRKSQSSLNGRNNIWKDI